jgi:hypothetical protein
MTKRLATSNAPFGEPVEGGGVEGVSWPAAPIILWIQRENSCVLFRILCQWGGMLLDNHQKNVQTVIKPSLDGFILVDIDV